VPEERRDAGIVPQLAEAGRAGRRQGVALESAPARGRGATNGRQPNQSNKQQSEKDKLETGDAEKQ